MGDGATIRTLDWYLDAQKHSKLRGPVSGRQVKPSPESLGLLLFVNNNRFRMIHPGEDT